MMEKFRNFDKKYIKRVLLNKDADDYLSLRLQEITIDEHYARLYMPAMIMHEKLQVILFYPFSRSLHGSPNVLAVIS